MLTAFGGERVRRRRNIADLRASPRGERVVFALHFAATMHPIVIACTPPPLLPRPRREWIRPVTLVVVCGAMVMGLVAGPRVGHFCSFETKADIAKRAVIRYANEAYPAWRKEYRCSRCPLELWQLDDFVGTQDRRDPWGREYQFTCGDAGIFVMSLGEDGMANTRDDIWSHQ